MLRARLKSQKTPPVAEQAQAESERLSAELVALPAAFADQILAATPPPQEREDQLGAVEASQRGARG